MLQLKLELFNDPKPVAPWLLDSNEHADYMQGAAEKYNTSKQMGAMWQKCSGLLHR